MTFRVTEPTVTIGLRLPLGDYTKSMELAQARGDKVLSTLLRDAISSGLSQLEGVRQAQSPEAHK